MTLVLQFCDRSMLDPRIVLGMDLTLASGCRGWDWSSAGGVLQDPTGGSSLLLQTLSPCCSHWWLHSPKECVHPCDQDQTVVLGPGVLVKGMCTRHCHREENEERLTSFFCLFVCRVTFYWMGVLHFETFNHLEDGQFWPAGTTALLMFTWKFLCKHQFSFLG